MERTIEAAGYFSVQGGKWHRAIVPDPTFMHDEQTACGLTVRPLNVTHNGNRPDYTHPRHFCKRCEAIAQRSITQRLEYLRAELRAERISYDELHELQSLVPHIEPGDVELLEAAGVPESPEEA